MLTRLDCARCDASFPPAVGRRLCDCGSPLFARYDLERAALEMRPGHLALRSPVLWRYREVLPLLEVRERLGMGEGFTPVVATPRLGEQLGLPSLSVKDESQNPTGSVKARGLAVALSMARSLGATAAAISSTGNAATVFSAYAARYGLAGHVFMPTDADATVVRHARAYGAVLSLAGSDAAESSREAALRASENGWYDCTALCEPFRIEGSKTLGYELAEQFEFRLPEAILYPTGGGSGIIALWKAFGEMEEMGFIGPARPRMYAVQSSACAPLVRAFEQGMETAPRWEGSSRTVATGLRVPESKGDFLVLRALHESRGAAVAVSDEEILDGVGSMARAEGLLLCAEGGATVAAARRLVASGHLTSEDVVVLVNPGTGGEGTTPLAPASPPY